MKPPDTKISVRIDAQTKERLQKAVEATGVDESLLVRKCVEALLDYIESEKSITFPLKVLPKASEKTGNKTSSSQTSEREHQESEGPTGKRTKAA